ncbi:MAG: hypothetical protein JWN70_2327 [Planctomycetaceae bacterium]|nr:hypothetical protein [Planctomycetaceae bacterium]
MGSDSFPVAGDLDRHDGVHHVASHPCTLCRCSLHDLPGRTAGPCVEHAGDRIVTHVARQFHSGVDNRARRSCVLFCTQEERGIGEVTIKHQAEFRSHFFVGTCAESAVRTKPCVSVTALGHMDDYGVVNRCGRDGLSHDCSNYRGAELAVFGRDRR